jgi:N-acetylglucosamine kinase-like BadF-type ATPase
MRAFLGLDGGGTKTAYAIVNETRAVLVRGSGPPSNPTRIGFPAAFDALRETCQTALHSTRIPLNIISLCAGLAGTGRAENREQMLQFFAQAFPNSAIQVCTDLELALSAMPPGPAMVLIVGTGSAAIARNAAGLVRREGGHGPLNSDGGSAFDIGHSAVLAVRNDANQSTNLPEQILKTLQFSNWAEIDSKLAEDPDSVYPRIFPVVATAADSGDPLAQFLLQAAAKKVTTLAENLASKQQLTKQIFPLAKHGGAIGRSRFFDRAIDIELRRVLPAAQISKLNIDLAEVAAWLALPSHSSQNQTAGEDI